MRDLNHTALVILGMLATGPKSGYDIKRLVDRSTRFFWSASYGQIYPELRALEEGGLVRGERASRGGRSRTAYELTPDGVDALRGWLTSSRELTHEVRDEGILKLFFSGVLEREEQLAVVAAMRARYEGLATRLRDEVLPLAAADGFPALTAECGVALYERLAEWCAETERRLHGAGEEPFPDTPPPAAGPPEARSA